jgi:dipeptidase E
MCYPMGELLKQRQEALPLRCLFSSFGFNSPVLSEKFARVIPQDDALRRATCLVIPYAGFHTERTFEREKQGLTAFGFSPENVIFVQHREDVEYGFPDYIYVPGGDPFKLLREMRERELLHAVKQCVTEKRAVYIGVSAGASVATRSIEHVMQVEDNNEIHNGLFGAMHLVNEGLLCHYDHYSHATLRACETVYGAPMKTVNDDQLLMLENGVWHYVGEDE